MVSVRERLEHEAGFGDVNGTYDYGAPSWIPVLQNIFSWTLAFATAGVLVNVYVMLKLIAIMRRQPMLNPAVTLFAMTASDIVLQLSLFTYNVMGQFVFAPNVSLTVQDTFCKMTLTVIHTTSSFR